MHYLYNDNNYHLILDINLRKIDFFSIFPLTSLYPPQKNNITYEEAFIEAKILYYFRMGQHIQDELFTFDSSKKLAVELNAIGLQKIKYLNKMFQ